MRFREVIICWDFLLAIIITVILFLLIPDYIKGSFSKDIYSIGISVLSIIFSVFFAALAIIISSSDDDFVKFLEEERIYSGIVFTFKYSLFIVFLALISSLVLFGLTSFYLEDNPCYKQNSLIFIFYIFIFFYSIFCVFNASIDSIKYSKYRSKYLHLND